MANTKKTSSSSKTGSTAKGKKTSTAKKGTSKSNTKGKTGKGRKNSKNKLSFYESNRPKIILIYFVVSFLFLCITFIPGIRLWSTIRGAFFAFFGFGLYFLDFALLILSFRIAFNSLKRSLFVNTFSAFSLSAIVSSICYLCVYKATYGGVAEYKENIQKCISIGMNIGERGHTVSGGILGSVFGGGLLFSVGKAVAFIVLILLLILFIILYFDISFASVGNAVLYVFSGGKRKLDTSKDSFKKRYSENQAHRKEVKQEKDKLRQLEKEEKRKAQRKAELERLKEKQENIQNASQQYDDESQNYFLDPTFTDESAISDDFDFSSTPIESDFESFKTDSSVFKTEQTVSDDYTPKYGGYTDSIFSTYDKNKIRKRKGRNGGADVDVTVVEKPSAVDSTVPETDPEAFSQDFEDALDVIDEYAKESSMQNEAAQDDFALTDEADSIVTAAAQSAASIAQKNRSEVENDAVQKQRKKEYAFPAIECLSEPDFSKESDFASEMKQTASKLVDTLKSFGVETTLIGVSRGPSVTRYELQPAPGVKISKITNLADDIALNLASSGVRIEAPIPNKSAVGIEIPNQHRSTVKLREIISSSEFKKAKSKLNVALGKDITGTVACADLAKMPHLLIAGTTGSGKSVCLNCMIVSILYNATPSEVKLLMIDPKQVEFSVYNGIQHLLVPVISDVRKAAASLAWAVGEMEKRYRCFASCGVRDIAGFNRYVLTHPEYEKMPQIVIFIDELNDLMMVSPKEVEDSICRLAQKARAAGMYLVVATQRPSVDVITGIIKANIPSRLSLSVSSQVDSRTILDTIGAEKLLGNGDMLFNPVGVSKPVRIQGAFVSDGEIEKIVDFLKSQQEAEYDDDVMDEIERNAAAEKKQQASASAGSSVSDGEDDMLEKAIEVAVEAGTISTSYLQRKLRIGYSKAARIVDELDEMGLIGASEGGSKPRKFLMTKVQLLERKASKDFDASSDTDGDFDIFSD